MSTNQSDVPQPEPAAAGTDTSAHVPIRATRQRLDDPEALRKIARVIIAMANRDAPASGDAAGSAGESS